MRIPDIGADPRAHGFPPNHPPMHSFLGPPVIALGLVFGNIYLTEKQAASEFSEEDEAALVVLAIQAGVAIENARLYAEKELAQRGARSTGTVAGTRTDRQGAARRRDPVAVRRGHGPAGDGRDVAR